MNNFELILLYYGKKIFMSFVKDFKLLLKARYPIIYINTYEEERVEYVIKSAIQSFTNRAVYSWDFIEGYCNNPNDNGYAIRNPLQALEFIDKFTLETPLLVLLKDFHLFLNDISVSRKLRNLAKSLRNQSKTIVIIASDLTIPLNLSDSITILHFPLPKNSEIKKELLRIQESLGYSLPEHSLDNLVKASQGLSLEKIRRVLAKIIATYKEINVESLDLVFKEKQQLISQTQILEFYNPVTKISDIGGLNELKSWLKFRAASFSKRAEEYGLPIPKGLLLVGIQGTGKSLTAKSIANEWNLPLLKLDVGRLFGGIIGESEARVRQMIQFAETISPCILWIDEIDKAFTGSNFNNDSGTTKRVFGTFITWLSEKKSPVFVVATANNIDSLPPELLRKGRFDEVFFIGLPDLKERECIFKVHLKKIRPKSWSTYDTEILSAQSNRFSGAEIEESIYEAMHIAFNENREFTTSDILNSLKRVVPLAYTSQKNIEELEDWASAGKIRLAS
ncbi:Ycf46 (chloroplast) [Guillardia theta]|uniref:Uncharacterized AAA domain-containing protein ycf46 n=2 Tax=Guillardia theta TaxID=55529 RepID=YCF46_GUITH|nr:Ycf46 [Guillardia theta]O78439.1 RecName: Full=Uncharacterized AAA domain-containing protein ycf46 [Guillardia theta]AAC35624.1 hypothetical chloroplast RF46 [Guillardia theta]